MAAACTDGAESTPTTEVFDSVGVTVVVNRGSQWREGDGWTVSSTPELTIGAFSGPEEYQFVSVVAAARQSDGDLVVVDGGAGTVRLYDRRGSFVTTLGGPGEGPGEFRAPAAVLVTSGDSVLVWDNLAFRLSRFDEVGTLVGIRTLDLAEIAKAVDPPLYPGPVAPLPGGDLLVRLVEKGKTSPSGVFRPESGILKVSGDLSAVDTLMFFGDTEQIAVEAPWGMYPIAFPEARETWIAHGGDPSTVCVGPQESPEIRCFDGDGSRRIVRWESTPAPITEAEIEDWRQRTLELFDLKLSQDQVMRMLDQVPIPSARPAYSQINLDPKGNLWVRTGPSGSGREVSSDYLVFDPEGVLLGRVAVPHLRVLDIGDDYILGIRRDELEVEYLEIYGITKATGED